MAFFALSFGFSLSWHTYIATSQYFYINVTLINNYMLFKFDKKIRKKLTSLTDEIGD
jgi:hypothetical protein